MTATAEAQASGEDLEGAPLRSANQPQVQVLSRDASLELDTHVARWMRFYGHRVGAPLPRYSSDIAAASLVLEQLAMPGFRVRIDCAGSGDYTLVWEVLADDECAFTWEVLAEICECSSLPLAICLATQEHPERASVPVSDLSRSVLDDCGPMVKARRDAILGAQ